MASGNPWDNWSCTDSCDCTIGRNSRPALAREAHARGGQDNATALVVRVLALDDADRAADADARSMPLPGNLHAGARLDDFLIEEKVHESRATLLYRVRHAETGQTWLLKTLQPLLEGDREAAERLLLEEWLGKRARSHYLPEILPLRERNYLYFVQSWHEGASLQQHLDAGRHFTCAEVAGLGIRLMKALGALHRLDVLHRDVKPGNLHLDVAEKLRLLDLGVAWCPSCPASDAKGGAGHAQLPGAGTVRSGQGRAGNRSVRGGRDPIPPPHPEVSLWRGGALPASPLR